MNDPQLEAAVAWGTLTALFSGSADFLGGIAARRTSTAVLVATSQTVGLALVLVVLPIFPAHFRWSDFFWGGLSGIGSAVTSIVIYRALAIGRMGIVSPVAALFAASIPVVYAFATGEQLRPLQLAGLALGLSAIVLVSGSASRDADVDARNARIALLFAVIGGSLYAASYICLARVGSDAGLYPAVARRIVSIPICVGIALVSSRLAWPKVTVLPLLFGTGILAIASTAFMLFAVETRHLAVAAVLCSLTPVSTLILARIFLHERLNRLQIAGACCALGGVILLAVP